MKSLLEDSGGASVIVLKEVSTGEILTHSSRLRSSVLYCPRNPRIAIELTGEPKEGAATGLGSGGKMEGENGDKEVDSD